MRNRRRCLEDSAADARRQEVREPIRGLDTVAVQLAVDKCCTRLADGAVKAASRAERGRSNAKRLDRADANLTIGLDGPQTER